MFSKIAKLDDALKTICKLFPDAYLVKQDSSRERLSNSFELASDVKPHRASSRQRKQKDELDKRQLSFDFWDSSASQQRGGI